MVGPFTAAGEPGKHPALIQLGAGQADGDRALLAEDAEQAPLPATARVVVERDGRAHPLREPGGDAQVGHAEQALERPRHALGGGVGQHRDGAIGVAGHEGAQAFGHVRGDEPETGGVDGERERIQRFASGLLGQRGGEPARIEGAGLHQ